MPAVEFETGNLTIAVMQSDAFGIEFRANNHPIEFHVDDFESAKAELESRGVEFQGGHDRLGRLLAGVLRRPGRQPARDPPPLRARGRITAGGRLIDARRSSATASRGDREDRAAAGGGAHQLRAAVARVGIAPDLAVGSQEDDDEWPNRSNHAPPAQGGDPRGAPWWRLNPPCSLAGARLEPRDLPVGVAGPAAATAPIEEHLVGARGCVRLHRYATRDSARGDRGPRRLWRFVATPQGVPCSPPPRRCQAVAQQLDLVAEEAGATVEDVVRRGAGPALASSVLPLVIAGLLRRC